MNRQESISFSSMTEFLVHALALEQELAARYAEMADCMEVHNNLAVARLFRELADNGESRADKLIRRAQGRELPRVPPWEYQWLGIETAGAEYCRRQLHYLMTPYHALKLALQIEQGAHAFYLRTVEGNSARQVQGLAAELLRGIQGHLELLRECLSRERTSPVMTQEDLDPPHMPE